MKGARVRVPSGILPKGYGPEFQTAVGTVIAESDDCVGVRFDGQDVPVIVRKIHVGAVLT